jgi:hypothetical protein
METQTQTVSSSNPQQPINSENTKTETAEKSIQRRKSKTENSPHSNWSLHNNLPREIRNIIPEMPAQNMPAQPHSVSPLVSQHRSHSCKIKSQS